MAPKPARFTVFTTPVISTVLAWIFGLVLRVRGWRYDIDLPHPPRAVITVAPHTSYWDFPVLVGAAIANRIDARWIGTHRLFRGPGKWLFRWLGGIPVDRARTNGLVDGAVEVFDEWDRLILGIAPEGTRFPTDHWKSGFYRIADGAGVPIGMVKADYATKRIQVVSGFTPTGDLGEDMNRIRAFYDGVTAKRPEWWSEPRLKGEDRDPG